MSFDKELKEFSDFKNNYKFNQLDIVCNDGKLYCCDVLLKDDNYIGESDKWVNVGYSLHGMYPKLLSNLFPYEFFFRGFKLNSIECFFQGIKFIDKDLQREVFKYSGKEALALQKCSDYDWKETGVVYWQGESIVRDSLEYDQIVTELYVSAIQNKFYRNAIKNCRLPIIHAMGENDKSKTVFTRYEFEFMLNCLHDFLNR
jgi:hypothetical protein